MKEQYAVCHLQRGSGNDSGMSCHIERKDAQGKTYVPDNADSGRTHLNRELVSFPDGVRNRTEAIQYRIDHAGLTRKVAGNQCKAIRIILTGTHEQMMKIQEEGRLERWMEANLRWLYVTFGKENVVSCVLHMDEKTPHLHATIVTAERQRREREGERKYITKSGPRLSADDVLKRAKLREYQNTYAAAMSEFGLKRGIVGSTARHIATSTHYKQQMQQLEENIANLQEEVEKTKEGKSTLLAIFGKGDLAKARKELAKLQAQIAKLEAEKATLKQKHESDIAKLRNGYQKEIDIAIRRAEIAERKVAEKAAVIERQKSRIDELDRKANPQRYRLSSGAELIGHRFLGNNPYTVTLKIWTKVKDIEHTAVTYLSDSDKRLHAFSNGELTEHEFVNACFSAAEQVSEIQANILSAAIELATGGSAQPHVGTGGGGSTSELPWRDKDKNFNKRTTIKRH